jgi:hypothetical protein
MSAVFGGAEFVDGQFVNQKVRQVVDAIREYCPEIEVQWVPPAQRKDGQAAYRLIHHPTGAKPYVMMVVRRDEDMDSRVLQRIIVNDRRYSDGPTLTDIEAHEAAERAVSKQAYLDALEEAHDIAAHALRTPLNTYRVNKDLVIKDGIPFNALKLK